MPSTNTITSFITFVAGTKARASEVNTNFSNFRGHSLPINTDTASASDLSYNLGSETHRWNVGYLGSVDLETSTTTASLVLQGQTSNTTGAFEFLIEGVTATVIKATGMDPGASFPLGYGRSSRVWGTFASSTATTDYRTITAMSITSNYGNQVEISFIPAEISSDTASAWHEFRFQTQSSNPAALGKIRIYRDTTTNIIFLKNYNIGQNTSTSSDTADYSSIRVVDQSATSGNHTYYIEASASALAEKWTFYHMFLEGRELLYPSV